MNNNISKFYRAVMSLAPQTLLSNTSRDKCISKLNELPSLAENHKCKVNAAVLVPLCVVDNEVCLLYTLRSDNLSSHKGQVSFPGGKMDVGETVYETALRETKEEIGLSSEEIEIWTKMATIPGRDNNILITPVVGVVNNFDINKLEPNESEVADIFTVPMKVFCNKKNHASLTYNNMSIPVYDGGKHRIWGITALITHFFLQSFLPQDTYQVSFEKKVYTLDELISKL